MSKDVISSTSTFKGHLWLSKARLRALVVELERVRNLNMHTIKYDKKLSEAYAVAAEKYNYLKTYDYLSLHHEEVQNRASVTHGWEVAKTLPSNLYDELHPTSAEFKKYILPNRMIWM
jgi:hypothetical protein